MEMYINSSAMLNLTEELIRNHANYRKYFTPWSAGHVAVAIILLVVFIVYCTFILFLLLHGPHRHHLNIQLAANCIIVHLPTAILYHPGTIHLHILMRQMSPAYCWLWMHFIPFATTITPYSLLMFSIERLIYIRDPTRYAQHIKRAGQVTLIVFPWVIAIILGIVEANLMLEEVVIEADFNDVRSNTSLLYNTCHTHRGSSFEYVLVNHILQMIVTCVFPLLTCLVITVVVLVMWCCFKRKHALGRDYSLMGDQVEVTVRNSVIAVSTLNFLYIIVFFWQVSLRSGLALSNLLQSAFGLIEGAVWILTLVDVRNKFIALFTCGRKRTPVETHVVKYEPSDRDST